MRHYLIVGVLVILVAILTYAGLDAAHLMPVEASVQAAPIDWLWNLEVVTISFLFALIVVPLMYGLFVFRRKAGDTSDAEYITGNTKLEITWTVIPLVLVLVFAYLGAYTLGETRRMDPQAMIVKVHARQFAWSFEYPEYGGFISDELHLPNGRQILLEMEAEDVIHSFWVPEFRVKQDVVPGRVTQLRITPTLNGSYKVRCAELCGSAHYQMESQVVVTEAAAFQQWAAAQQSSMASAQTPAAKGELLVKNNGCLGCHTVNGSALVGPTWQGLFGSQASLEGGSSVAADEAYIKESILDPQAKIAAGFTSVKMPAYVFSDEDLANIIAYIETLK